MSIQVDNNLRKDENTEVFEQKAHYMACSIADDGPANVNKYFEPYIADENGGKQTNVPLLFSNKITLGFSEG